MKNLFIDIGWMVVMGVLIAGGVMLFPFIAGVLLLLLAHKKLNELFSPQPEESINLSYGWQSSGVGDARLFRAP